MVLPFAFGGGKSNLVALMLHYDIKAKYLVVDGKNYVLYDVLPIKDSSPEGILRIRGVAKAAANSVRVKKGVRVRICWRPRAKIPHVRLYVR